MIFAHLAAGTTLAPSDYSATFAEGACESDFTPVIVKGDPPAAAGDPESAMITVEIGGARVRIGADAPAALIVATLKALRS
jgi:hypothetical protein